MPSRTVRPIAFELLRRSEHLLFAALIILGVINARGSTGWPAMVAGAIGVAGWYVLGMALARRSRDQRFAVVWLVVLVLGCAGLAVGSDGFVWLAFPLFLLCTQLLPLRVAVPAVALLTVATIARISAAREAVDASVLVGPLIGATVAVVIVVVYRDLAEQTRQRTALIEQLTATRDELAASQHQAGILAERERLARELHDTVTQGLTSIVLVLRAIRDSSQPAADTHSGQLDTAIASAQEVLSQTRRMVQAMTPAELAGNSLPEAIAKVADDSGLPARVHIDGEPAAVPTPVAVALLRATQEALANVAKHAAAHRVDVTVSYLPEVISLDVIDDGVGFDTAQPYGRSTGTGLGLAGIRARAAEIDGSVEIDSQPGRGTALNVTVPRRSPDDD